MRNGIRGLAAALVVAGLGLAIGGCDKPATKDAKPKTPVAGAGGHKHDEWWCTPHGIPEEECSMCSPKVAAEFKKKGDWCDMHDRAKSQCFICDPKLKPKFAAQYKAKYGKEPPPTEDEEPKKDDKK